MLHMSVFNPKRTLHPALAINEVSCIIPEEEELINFAGPNLIIKN